MQDNGKRTKVSQRRGRGGKQSGRGKQSQQGRSRGGDTVARAKQSFERYTALARDAASAGNDIDAENFYQHAEHYLRTMRALNGDNEGYDEGAAAGEGVSAS
jgi:Domain of unknown function (DUF4167)